MMVYRETTQTRDWTIYLPAFLQFHPTVLLLVRQTTSFSRWQHGRDTAGCCGPHGDEYRQVWLSLTSPRLQFHGSGHLWQCLKSSICSFSIFFFLGSPNFRAKPRYCYLGAGCSCWLSGPRCLRNCHKLHSKCQTHMTILSWRLDKSSPEKLLLWPFRENWFAVWVKTSHRLFG